MGGEDGGVGCIGAHRTAVVANKLHTPNGQTRDATCFPGVEAFFVALKPVFEGAVIAEEDPRLHGPSPFDTSMAQRKPTMALFPFHAPR
jgi:hypothetical protein